MTPTFNPRSAPSIRFGLALIILMSLLLAASTWRVYSHTWDEPEHLAAGLELLDRGRYEYDIEHPPLARDNRPLLHSVKTILAQECFARHSSLLDETLTHGVLRYFGVVCAADFFEYPRSVGAHRLWADAEFLTNHDNRGSASELAENLQFPLR
jgi:hypothetical protein